MTFSEFISILRAFRSKEERPADFILRVIDNFMVDPLNPEDAELSRDGVYNPLVELGPSMRKSIANGNRTIAKSKAEFILNHRDKAKFSEFILEELDKVSDDTQSAICKKLRDKGIEISEFSNVGNICAGILEGILTILADTTDYKNKNSSKKKRPCDRNPPETFICKALKREYNAPCETCSCFASLNILSGLLNQGYAIHSEYLMLEKTNDGDTKPLRDIINDYVSKSISVTGEGKVEQAISYCPSNPSTTSNCPSNFFLMLLIPPDSCLNKTTSSKKP